MKRTQSFTLVEIIAVLVMIAIMAAVAIPKFINMSEEARAGIAQAGINEGKANLSVAYAKAYLGAGGGAVTGADVLGNSSFVAGSATFGDVTVTAAAVGQVITLTCAYSTPSKTGTWTAP